MALSYSMRFPASWPCPPPAPASTPQHRLRPFSRQKLFTSCPAATTVSQYPLLSSSFIDRLHPFSHSPSSVPTGARRLTVVKSVIRTNFNVPLISPEDQWGTWTALLAAGAFGIWSERTEIGSTLSGSLVSILVGLAASNLGIIASEASAYKIVMGFLLPIAVPLLLFRADLRRVIKSTGTLLLAFLLGSVATTVGTAIAYVLVPMRSLGQDSWKIAAALMGRHIGGAVNYVAIADALEVSPSVLTAGLAADNVICAVYFSTLFALASKVPLEASSSGNVNFSSFLVIRKNS